MPLNVLLAGTAFDDAKIRRIIDAFDAAVAHLKAASALSSDPAAPARMTLAKRIIAMAESNMTVARLRDDALAHLKNPSPAT